MNNDLFFLSERLGVLLKARKWQLATAESCTGGGVAAAITSVPGSSDWFGYGLVSYANQAKQKLLGVRQETLDAQGAVSAETVSEMVAGALQLSGADIAVAISGVAGPGGGTVDKPVGSVWFAWAQTGKQVHTRLYLFKGNRQEIQQLAVKTALKGLIELLEKNTV